MDDDLISRKAAIDALEKEKSTPFVNEDGSIDPFGAGRQNQWYRDGIAIMSMPSAERWIPCEVRLPKPNQLVGHVTKYYLIQDEFGDMMVASYQSNERGETWWEQMNSFHAIQDEIVAWQELPKPWKGEEDD